MTTPESTKVVVKPTRRRFRFGLSTLMLIVALLGLWLGLHINRTNQQLKAIELVEQLGGKVYYDYEYDDSAVRRPNQQPWTSQWVRDLVGIDFCHNVAWVHLADSGVADADLLRLGELRELRGLALSGTKVTNNGLSHLRHLKKMQRLWLYSTEITDSGLENLTKMSKLEELVIGNPEPLVGDAGFQHISKLTALKRLELWGPGFTPLGLRDLVVLKNLEFIQIRGAQRFTPEDRLIIRTVLPKVKIDAGWL